MNLPKLLYVDDDEIDRIVMERYSSGFSFDLHTCNSVAAAKERVEDAYVGMIIDWNLCDGEGREVASLFRKVSPTKPLIFISGVFDEEQLEQAKAYSPLACVEKGGSPDYAREILMLMEKNISF